MVVIGPTHIAKEFSIGNTRIKISDDYCKDKTSEDVEIILQRIARNALMHFNAVPPTST